jgi:DNA primase/energy-coupling factor transporter ATP-binding protein EcfA2
LPFKANFALKRQIKKLLTMEIPEIKSRLSLSSVLHYYGLKPDKQGRLQCPFHEDKTPSLQVYYKTGTCYCFSSNCKTHGNALDVIDFIMHKENISKHEALQKATEMVQGTGLKGTGYEVKSTPCTLHPLPFNRTKFLQWLFTYFKNAVYNSKPAQEYLKGRCLDYRQIEVGYNAGQFHHGTRKDETLIAQCLEYGLLLDVGKKSRVGDVAYQVFGKHCIAFPLKNKDNQVVSLYFRSIINDTNQRHFYLKNRQGLYPGYPAQNTKVLILTESIIDCASLAGALREVPFGDWGLLACFGTNGLSKEHLEAIKSLKELKEIIFAFDNDDAGRAAVQKYANAFSTVIARNEAINFQFSTLDLPCKDVNETLQAHNAEIFTHLLNERKPFSFSTESSNEKKKEVFQQPNVIARTACADVCVGEQDEATSPLADQTNVNETNNQQLNTADPHNLFYPGETADYYVKGGIRCSVDCLKVSLQIIDRISRMEIRTKADLYEHRQINNIIKLAGEQLSIDKEILHRDLSFLTKELENYRCEILKAQNSRGQKKAVAVPAGIMNECIDFLKSDNLLQRISELLGQSGIVGEDTNRLFLFLIACSYKMPDTLHALIQGSSGSGKTRLLKIICEVMPPEDVIKFTRVTDNSFYNYREDYLMNKLLGFEDIDGLKEEAMYAVRELISNEILVSSTTTKTDDGRLVAVERTVRGPVASISCTTKGEIYEDNMSRVFLIAVDESATQTKRIIEYQQQTASGQIEHRKEKETRQLIQNCVRLLQPYEVVNPYASQIHLPEQAHKIRRLNDLYLSFVKQITLLHQHQRKKDAQGRLISQREDLRMANEIMFESIVLKVDELDGSLRQFFERLKKYVASTGNREQWFILRNVRQALHLSKTQLHRYINELVELEYLQQKGFANRGFQYQITYWDNIELIRNQIKQKLEQQIDELKSE